MAGRTGGELALGELEAGTGAGLAVLLAFLDAGVAGDQAGGLEHAALFRQRFEQGAGDAVKFSTG